MDFGISDKSYHYMMSVFQARSAVEKVVLFGSRAMGNAKPGSDIDLALFGEKVNHDEARLLAMLLNEEGPIPNFVDVLVYHEIENVALRKHIDEAGKIIFQRYG